MKIKVEQRHIDEGRPSCPYDCMVTRAIYDTSGYDAMVARTEVLIMGKFYDLPEHVQAAIDMYDDGQQVEPFEFGLELSNERNE